MPGVTLRIVEPKTIGERIADIATSYVGQTEIPGNKGFTNPEFQKKMVAMGFKISHAWCMYLCELVWKEAYGSKHSLFGQIDKLFSASALSTYYNFAGNEGWKVNRTPSIGSIMIFKHGTDPRKWEGHGCIVVDPEAGFHKVGTIDGNTNSEGSREGYIVARKTRSYGNPPTAKGLNFLGFIHPV
jgi:hypothetical protein